MKTVTIEQRVHTFQIDFSRHLSNIVYIQWLEIARLALLEDAGMAAHDAHETMGVLPVLVRTEIDYLRPAFLGDVVQVSVWITEMGRASAVMDYEFRRGKDVLARARQRGLFIDAATQKPHRISAEDRARFFPYCTPEAAGTA